MFTDVATVKIQAGKGGDGKLNFRSSRGNAKGGPDGGDGGRGGDVVLIASNNTNTLAKYRSSKLWQAQNGGDGGTNLRHGKNGEEIILKVPVGTVVYDNNQQIADLVKEGQITTVAQGGRGGFGNAHFKSSIRQAPKMAELGEEGEAKTLKLELKLVADVGLVGLPNAGKSTLLSMVSNAKPEIANYEFTTLIPNLGVVEIGDVHFLLADIPGLIEGASKGKGLGDEFLRHVERCKVLIQLIDVNSDDIVRDYKTIRSELKNYAVDLSKRPYILALTKSETKPKAEVQELKKQLTKASGVNGSDIFTISAVTTQEITSLMQAASRILKAKNAVKIKKSKPEIPTITLSEDQIWQVEKVNNEYVVTGKKIEGFAKRTNFSQVDGVRRLRDILKKTGVMSEIGRLGGQEGDVIVIAGRKFKC